MWGNIFMKVALIGNGVQSKRIQKILKKIDVKFKIFTSKDKVLNNKLKIKELKSFSAIFILSPNNSHYNYIKELYKKNYIFCEKPPVCTMKQLKNIKNIKSNKLYFNFNFIFSKLGKVLKNKERYKLGKLLTISIMISYGLAKKKIYLNNWRSKKNECPKGIFEVVLIHYLNLITDNFFVKKMKKFKLSNVSKKGSSYDTAECQLELKDNVFANLFATYDGPLTKKIIFLFTNGIIEQNENQINIAGPAENYDQKGFFIKPKNKEKFKISEKKDYENSLNESVEFFIKTVKNKKFFKKKIFTNSIKANSFIFSKINK
jgi:predicted dehydrogenase